MFSLGICVLSLSMLDATNNVIAGLHEALVVSIYVSDYLTRSQAALMMNIAY